MRNLALRMWLAPPHPVGLTWRAELSQAPLLLPVDSRYQSLKIANCLRKLVSTPRIAKPDDLPAVQCQAVTAYRLAAPGASFVDSVRKLQPFCSSHISKLPILVNFLKIHQYQRLRMFAKTYVFISNFILISSDKVAKF